MTKSKHPKFLLVARILGITTVILAVATIWMPVSEDTFFRLLASLGITTLLAGIFWLLEDE